MPLDTRDFDSVLQAHLGDLRVRGYSDSLVKQGRIFLPRFFAYLRRACRLRDIRRLSEEHVFGYARHLATVKSSKGTVYSFASQTSYLEQVRRLCRYLLRTGVLLQDPSVDLVLPTWSKLPRVVPTQQQMRRLLSLPYERTTVGKRDKALLELLYGSGIRVGECERLDLQDLDLGQGTLFVRNGKGKKDRVVPVAGRAAVAVEAYLRDARAQLAKDPHQQAVFLAQGGERLTRKRIQQLVHERVAAAGLKLPITPYALRHGFATHLLQRGADVRHVQRLLGHSQLQTTALYTRVAIPDLRKVLKKAHPRERVYNRRRKAACRRTGD